MSHDTQVKQEPTLEELSLEAATFLESIPDIVTDKVEREARQIAFALRSRVSAPIVAPEVDHDAFVRAVAMLPCARVDGDQCCFFERGIANYCPSCQARELLERPAPASPAALRDEADIFDDDAVDKELHRWQDAIRDKMISMGVPDSKIDGAGCDSGDHLDFTLAEVGQGVGYFLDQLEELRATTTPPSTLAKAAAGEIAANYEVHKNHCHSNERYPLPPCDCGAIDEIAAIIERCFSGGEDQKSTPTGL